MSLQDTPQSQRLNIGIFGRTNSGKSSLLNALTNQKFAVVSDVAGTTTDPVYKTMEIHGIGPVVFIDTAGFNDFTELGQQRIAKTQEAANRTDVALLLFTPDCFCEDEDSEKYLADEKEWLSIFRKKNIPAVCILNKCDLIKDEEINSLAEKILKLTDEKPVCVSAENSSGTEKIKEAVIRKMPSDFMERTFTGNLCGEGDSVVLVMPQDIQAPKGRLILPQVQILRELLDKKCIVTSCTTDKFAQVLDSLKNPPKLIITDSQVFKTVYEMKPAESLLTSFSTLLAATKGNIEEFLKGAEALNTLNESSRILIAEACTHAPLAEDIGRVKIPRMLKNKFGQSLKIDIVNGTDFPENLSPYDLIIQCGACMFNRSYVLNRQQKAKDASVPMTNYGITIAALSGILDKVSIPL